MSQVCVHFDFAQIVSKMAQNVHRLLTEAIENGTNDVCKIMSDQNCISNTN